MNIEWTALDITTEEHVKQMLTQYKHDHPQIGAFDTETTGLHIIADRPFLFQFGWLARDMTKGYTYVIDIEQHEALAYALIRAWHKHLAPKLDIYAAHNVKFDLHMCDNISCVYGNESENLSDSMFYIRYAHDAVTPDKGGPPLRLKEYCAQFITHSAKAHENLLKLERSAMAKEFNQRLRKAAGRQWKDMFACLSDVVLGADALSPSLQGVYATWRQSLPIWLQNRIDSLVEPDDIPYHKLNRANVIRYAHKDIELVLMIIVKLTPVIDARENWWGLELERKLIQPYYDQERVGFLADKVYMESSRAHMREHIIKQRELFCQLAGAELKSGQHAAILKVLQERFNLAVTSTNKKELAHLLSVLKHTEPDHPAIQFIELLKELRSLEKWYAVYILRFQRQLRMSDRLYTQINQVGTVSGRVTSDFQQFPREGVRSVTGEVLYNPRKAVLISGGDYDKLVYIDYSQIELRLQAMYTILVGAPEPNLCKAYMPWGCVDSTGNAFDPMNYTMLKTYQQHEWFDNGALWKPLDVHAASTIHAFDVTPDHPDFKKYRSMGKTYNFMKVYGGGRSATEALFPDYDDERIDKVDGAFYKAFPNVRVYHEYCQNLMNRQSYGTNLFGVRYYNVSGHNMINMLVQGSAAYLLKLKIREMWEYTRAHGIKSRAQMNIHDENIWEKHKDEDMSVFMEYKRIMEDWPDTLIPLVAEVSISSTNWAEKKELDL